MVIIENVNKTFGNKHVLKNISAKLYKGKCNLLLVLAVVVNLCL